MIKITRCATTVVAALISAGIAPQAQADVTEQAPPQSYVSDIAGDPVKVKFAHKKGEPAKYKYLVQKATAEAEGRAWTTYPKYPATIASRSKNDDRCIKLGSKWRKVQGKQWVHTGPIGAITKWYPLNQAQCEGKPWI